MKLQRKRGLCSALMLLLMTPLAYAGGVAEVVPEPTVQAPRPAPAARPVVPTERPRVHCVWVPVATQVAPAQTFVNQGLVVTSCCCGAITIAGSVVTISGSVSVQQELRCDVGGDQ